MKHLQVGLCQGRHEMPVSDFIFANEVNPLDARGLERQAESSLAQLLGLVPDGNGNRFHWNGAAHVDIYVSGLAVALVAALNVCMTFRWDVTLWHFDREAGSYFPQEVDYKPYGE